MKLVIKQLHPARRHVSFRGKKILITSGPTWVALDSVRVISNTATGETGVLLAQECVRRHARVTLLLGPTGREVRLPRPSRVIPYRFFDELEDRLMDELDAGGYDAIVHSAAVSDYEPSASYRWKVSSGMDKWNLLLKPTPKLIDALAGMAPHAFLAGFKYEPGLRMSELLTKARTLRDHARLDAVVANTVRGRSYKAYIVGQVRTYGPYATKSSMAAALVKLMGERL